jgi:hypothetical protein
MINIIGYIYFDIQLIINISIFIKIKDENINCWINY